MQGKEWIEREKQRRHPHLDLFGDERRKCEKERMDAERLFHTFRLQPKKTAIGKKDAKTRHKSTSNMADKHPRIPVKTSHRPGSAPLPHPGLHDGYTRVSSGFASCF